MPIVCASWQSRDYLGMLQHGPLGLAIGFYSVFSNSGFFHTSPKCFVAATAFLYWVTGAPGSWLLLLACCVPGESVTEGALRTLGGGYLGRLGMNSQTGDGDVILQRFVSKSMCGSRILPRQSINVWTLSAVDFGSTAWASWD